MPQPCDPLSECKDLDGKLLLQRAVYGPQLAFDPGAVAVGGVATRGSALRALVHLRFEVRWRATGLCYGPPTSIMGLAPGEVVTVGLRTRSSRTFSNLVRNAAERAQSSTRTDRPIGSVAGDGGGIGLPGAPALGGLADLIDNVAGAVPSLSAGGKVAGELGHLIEQTTKLMAARKEDERSLQEQEEAVKQAIELTQEFIGKFGSSIQDAAGAIGGALRTGASGAVEAVSGVARVAGNAVVNLVDNVVGGAGGAGPAANLLGTLQQISEIIETVERSESESSLQETTVTTTTESEQTVTRTFGNPYLDRSLQLRFIPVFQRFEVSTRPISGTAGLATVVAEPDDPATAVKAPAPSGGVRGASAGLVAEALGLLAKRPSVKAALNVASHAGAESGLRGTMLSTVQKATQASGVAKSVRLDQGLAWDRTSALGNAIHVPLAAADVVAQAWRLKAPDTQRLQGALTRLRPEGMKAIVPQPVVRVVHVFAGLHVEAVPGSCVLPDIPEHLRVIVPGGTTYAPVRQPAAPVTPNA